MIIYEIIKVIGFIDAIAPDSDIGLTPILSMLVIPLVSFSVSSMMIFSFFYNSFLAASVDIT